MPSPVQMALAALRRPGTPVVAPPSLLAIGNIASGSRYQTATTAGGELGVATGFGGVIAALLKRLPTTTQVLRGKITGAGGWQVVLSPTGLNANFHNGSGFVGTAAMPLSAQDVGRVFIFAARITAAPGVAETCLNGIWSSTTPAMSGYLGVSVLQMIGSDSGGSSPSTDAEIVAAIDFRGLPTRAEIEAYMRSTRPAMDLPAVFTGATVTHRPSLKDALVGQTVVDGQAGPATIADTITGAAADVMTIVGTPVVRTISPSIDGRKSYGVGGFDATSWLQTAIDKGLVGSASGHWSAWLGIMPSTTPGTAVLQERVRQDTYVSGHTLAIYNNQPYFGAYSAANTLVATPFYTLTSGDVGMPVLFVGVRTAGALRLYVRDVQIGADQAISGYTPPAAGTNPRLSIGARVNGSSPITSARWLGSVGGDNGAPTAAQISQLWADIQRTGRIQPIAGLTSFLADPTQDIAPAPAAGVPSQVLDRVGTDHLARVGTGLQVARRTERLFSLEDAPVISGFAPTAATTFYESTATGHDGGASGKSIAVLFRIDAQTVNKARDILSIARPADPAGSVTLRVSGANSAAVWYWWTGSTAVATGAVPFTAADVGKLILMASVFDPVAGRVRVYHKRVEAGTGAAMATYAAYGAGLSLRLGTIVTNGYPTYFAEETTIFGAQTYDGAWSVAEVQALHDACVAEEDMIAVPGKSGHLYSLKQAIGQSGALPATVPDLSGSSPLTRMGTPTLRAQYAHAFAA